MSLPVISFEEGERGLDWLALTDAIAAGHAGPRAEVEDVILRRGGDTVLSRAAWIDGLGIGVKTATVFPGNGEKGLPSVGGATSLFSDATGELEAMVDFHLVTKWKTAGDSLLAARRLARPESRDILIVGAGTVAASLVGAYGAAFPEARFTLWNRSRGRAEALAAETGAAVAEDLETAVRGADIVATATMSTEPLIRGAWLRPGQHLDLIGAYRPDMREVDDAAIAAGRLFVDSRKTAGETGELALPMEAGVLGEGDLVADYYDLPAFRREGDEITLFKNGGGAHLDLMVARHILSVWQGM
ncbi:ornithine cyclodeaminase family protein [Pseudoroseicyclus tamaricis]|uniref:Ornithine cyclodeaminase n=1 Tax=Pseudoroseicyclus tamaricis TaxID=2705421 RepID=A0A6B2JZK3_9RHOB|nr:ornithine cyclodeaminase [Pseudoroseicyclus tamaricis]NDV02079.1 ornithine cyclodeaminase [Pseudoroseicyclus tamaricis]